MYIVIINPVMYADHDGAFVGMIIGTIVATTVIIIGVGANVYNIYDKENIKLRLKQIEIC